ncbi:excalibur calcium-binding domain-containing protein [Paenibacillus sediminis]|uniref:excalibur calcium-binding domain-containing protein n=1 Tax=Paenibacillus sediminis TaxID=664909 RepID=UPI001FD86572|nr:excalibur calcium-binding domain-containing protein [Paenibacillus sediminis]
MFVISGSANSNISEAKKVTSSSSAPKSTSVHHSSSGASSLKSSSSNSTTSSSSSSSSHSSSSVYYKNCTAVREAGKAPLYKGDPGYSSKLDRDGDGVACE